MFSTDLVVLCLACFTAGFVDSIVGGGGLIQLPALIMCLPGHALLTVLGTNKMISITGNSISAYRFSKHIPFIFKIIFPTAVAAFIFSVFGAWVVSIVSNEILKPVFMVLLFVIFLITLKNKNFGLIDHQEIKVVPVWKLLTIGALIGFYDGFFGPGTGSLLIIAFVGILNMTFVQGSAYAKIINFVTNIAAISFFIFKGAFLIDYVIPLMFFNMAGAFLGVRFALLRGNVFVRGLLRVVIFFTILKLGFDVLKQYLI